MITITVEKVKKDNKKKIIIWQDTFLQKIAEIMAEEESLLFAQDLIQAAENLLPVECQPEQERLKEIRKRIDKICM